MLLNAVSESRLGSFERDQKLQLEVFEMDTHLSTPFGMTLWDRSADTPLKEAFPETRGHFEIDKVRELHQCTKAEFAIASSESGWKFLARFQTDYVSSEPKRSVEAFVRLFNCNLTRKIIRDLLQAADSIMANNDIADTAPYLPYCSSHSDCTLPKVQRTRAEIVIGERTFNLLSQIKFTPEGHIRKYIHIYIYKNIHLQPFAI